MYNYVYNLTILRVQGNLKVGDQNKLQIEK